MEAWFWVKGAGINSWVPMTMKQLNTFLRRKKKSPLSPFCDDAVRITKDEQFERMRQLSTHTGLADLMHEKKERISVKEIRREDIWYV